MLGRHAIVHGDHVQAGLCRNGNRLNQRAAACAPHERAAVQVDQDRILPRARCGGQRNDALHGHAAHDLVE